MTPIALLCLAGVVALGLVLPVSAALVRDRGGPRPRTRAVLAGQVALAAAGGCVLALPSAPWVGLGLGLAGVLACWPLVHPATRAA